MKRFFTFPKDHKHKGFYIGIEANSCQEAIKEAERLYCTGWSGCFRTEGVARTKHGGLKLLNTKEAKK